MSDSSNNLVLEEQFNPLNWLLEKCNGTKVTPITFGQFEFKSGWQDIIENFIHSIKNQSINLTCLEER
ncbi:MAG: hypothetical protein WAX04_14740, partial [Oscillospiraceae bacterium]